MKAKQKCPSVGGKQFFVSKIKNTRKSKRNEEGLGPSEVALWATSPDP